MKKVVLSLALTSLLVAPVAVLAAEAETGAIPTSEQAVYNTINSVVNWLFAFLMIGAAIIIILAAYTFLTAAGDPDKTSKARSYITYALVAIIVGFLAKAVIVLVGNMLNVDTGGILF